MFLSPTKARFLKVGVLALMVLIVQQCWIRINWKTDQFVRTSHSPKPGNPGPVKVELPSCTRLEQLPTASANEINETLSSQNDVNSTDVPLCPIVPPGLQGHINVDLTNTMKLRKVEELFPMVAPGGEYRPSDCQARNRIAVIVPFRDREMHLPVFLNYMHSLLQKQMLDYSIYVVEQFGNDTFNKGVIMNAAYVEATRDKKFDCVVFHDVDLIPEDDRNLYSCPEQPRHMSVAVDTMRYKLKYYFLVGGVLMFPTEQFKLVNGYSTLFWGWGGEDDDMWYRIQRAGLCVLRYPESIARYVMLPHKKAPMSKDRLTNVYQGFKHYDTAGLNSLSYVKKDLQKTKLFTWLLIEVPPPPR